MSSPAPWYKDAVVYELHVRSFHDSNADGVGDFRGLTERLDYLQDLGVTALWLLPFYPSPLRDDGYDIADYTGVHPMYGNLADVRMLLREAHRRGLRVITELVINHTSDQHPWFQRERRERAAGRENGFYVWSPSPDRYRGARVIFRDFEPSNWTWDPQSKSYYWHRFYAHQPDLNFDNPQVRRAVLDVLDFWMDLGVDGMRLDAIPYLFEREQTNCENLPETHGFLREIRAHVDRRHRDRLLLAEANQWPEQAAAYFGRGDECHMAFHFPLMPRLFMALHQEDRFPLVDILDQTPAIPDICQWALFLRNHDELTLEMVTDEERDYMVRVYAHDPQARINLGIRRRLAPLLGNNRRKIELMNGLLFSLPGTPVLYYGDEIGMGDNIFLGDRNGVRTPMQWSADRNAGFSRANPQRLFLPVNIDPEYHYETVNVEAQRNNPHSLLWWMKRLISLRRRHPAFGRGSIEFLRPSNPKILSFVRRHEDEVILVVANLSRFVQFAELDLSAHVGRTPVELFGQIVFPPVTERPYFLTLGPHSFYWFALRPARTGDTRVATAAAAVPELAVADPVGPLAERPLRERVEELLRARLLERRWLSEDSPLAKSLAIVDEVPIPSETLNARIVVLGAEAFGGDATRYQFPLALLDEERAERLMRESPGAAIARLKGSASSRWLVEALALPEFCRDLFDGILRRRRYRGGRGEIVGVPLKGLRGLTGGEAETLSVRLIAGGRSHPVAFGERLLLKLYTRLDEGVNPDYEIGVALTERTSFRQIARVGGGLEYRDAQGRMAHLAVLQEFIPSQTDAWSHSVDLVHRTIDEALAASPEPPPPPGPLLTLLRQTPPEAVRHHMAAGLEAARLLGVRTGELHAALASIVDDAAFAPEEFNEHAQRSLYQSLRGRAAQACALLRSRRSRLPEDASALADRVLSAEAELQRQYQRLTERPIDGVRIRIHGDLHLGQVLYTGKDFHFIDFEGEAMRSLSERRLKRSPLRDVASLVRSYHYAAAVASRDFATAGVATPERAGAVRAWTRTWEVWSASNLLRGYDEAVQNAGFRPCEEKDRARLLHLYLLDKAVTEIVHEVEHRPSWVAIPLEALLELLASTPEAAHES